MAFRNNSKPAQININKIYAPVRTIESIRYAQNRFQKPEYIEVPPLIAYLNNSIY